MNAITWAEFSNELAKKATSEGLPLNGTFELTPLCNFRCKMCYVRLDKNQMAAVGRMRTTEEWISLGRQAADMGCLTLLLTGGEPFSRPDFRQIYEALVNMGFLITIYTNAALITEEVVKWLSALPPKFVRVSLYGASNETYFRVCGDPYGYDHAIKGIKLLQEAGIPLGLITTLINDNESDLHALTEFASDNQLPFFSTVAVTPPVRGAVSSALASRFCSEKVKKVIERMPSATYDCYSPDVKPLNRCSNSRSRFWVTWDGRMTLCSTSTAPFTHPFEPDFKSAWNELGFLLRQIQPPRECLDCMYIRYCQSCIGLFCSESGSPDKLSDRICSQAKARYELLNKQHID